MEGTATWLCDTVCPSDRELLLGRVRLHVHECRNELHLVSLH